MASIHREFRFQKGPIFSQIVLADEINRATPKTQSAMLEAMQERSVTVGGTTYDDGQAVLRDGDAEPHRAGRHLPAARSAARPVLLQTRSRLRRAARTCHEILNRTTGGAEPQITPVLDSALRFCKLPAAHPACVDRAGRAGLRNPLRAGDASRRTVRPTTGTSSSCASALRRALRRRSCWQPRRVRCSTGAGTCRLTTSRLSSCPPCVIACC